MYSFGGVPANSGTSRIISLERMQSITDSFSIERVNINQIGQLAALSREITTPPATTLGGSWYVADLSNDRLIGLYVSGDQSALTNILNQSQSEKNYFVTVAPEGQDNIGWTGQKQTLLFSNGYLASWSTEGSVGNIPTTTFGIQGFNYASYTGSANQQLNAINPVNGNYTTGILFTVPTATSGITPTVSALRPTDITVAINNATIGLNVNDIKVQSYNISFDLNLEKLNKLGSLYPYAILPKFPVTVSANVTAYYGDFITGSLRDVLCADSPYNVTVTLNDPCGGGVAVQYALKGMKTDSQSFGAQDIGSTAATVTLAMSTQLGGPNDLSNGLYLSGRNI